MTNRCESCANRRISIRELSRIRVNPSVNRRTCRASQESESKMTILAVSIRAFAADSRKFTQIRTHSRRIRGWIRAHSRRIRFPRIPQDSPGFPRIPPRIYAHSRSCPKCTGFARIYADSRKFATDIRRFTDGFTPIRESSRMDIRRFAQDSQRLVIILPGANPRMGTAT